MKQFENKPTTIGKRNEETGEELGFIYFADLAIITLNISPKNGWTTDEMRKRLPLSDKLSKLKPNAEILLENSEVDLLKDCLNIQWKMAHQSIIDYEDYINNLVKSKDVKVKKTS